MTDRPINQLQLKVGGSLFELIEFSLIRNVRGKVVKGIYGVNVIKVREVVRLPKINTLASRIKGVAGVFELRGVPIPAVHLSVVLGDEDAEISDDDQIIVTEFSHKRAGFIVSSTHRIRRIGWDKIMPPSADGATYITGMTLIENNQFLFILDLERIIINLESQARSEAMPMGMDGYQFPWMPPQTLAAPPGPGNVAESPPANGPSVLLVDDSPFIRVGVRTGLERMGYRVTEAGDGAEGFAKLQSMISGGEKVDVIVADVEMPRMDGLSFTKKVRAHPTFGSIPIILHTSLAGQVNQEAGMIAGANGYLVKNDMRSLLQLLKEIVGSGPQQLIA